MSLIKNSFWNILGFALPVVMAIPAMGYMARVLGVEKFGIFTLCYAIVGYASLFDLGLSRAVIRAVAIDADSREKVGKIIGAASMFVFLVGMLAAGIMFLSSEWLVVKLSISEPSSVETKESLQWLSLAVPAFLLSTVWFSYLEGMGEFYKLNIFKSLSGFSIALFPMCATLYAPTLVSAVMGLVAGRMLSMLIAYVWGLRGVNKVNLWKIDLAILKKLLSFGGWITVSNIISPMMVYFDRFYISHILGARDVAFYTAPAEAVSRLLIIPMAVGKVVFPKLSARHKDAEAEARFGFWLLLGVCVCLAVFIGCFAEEILFLWLGADYVGESVVVLQVLLVGFVFNSIAQIPFSRIQAAGHAKVTALIHVAEVIPYFCVLYFLVANFSYLGAAIAWVLRVAVDYLVLEFLSRKYSYYLASHAG